MMKKILGILTLFIGLVSCAQHTDYDKKLESLYSNTVPTIQPQQLKLDMDSGKTLYILDSREQEEYKVSHIPGATYVGYDNFEQDSITNIPKDAKVVVYCSVGYRSERVGEKLKKQGYSNVYNLYGGIFQWKNENYGVVDMQGKPTEKVHAYDKSWGKWLKKGEKVYGR